MLSHFGKVCNCARRLTRSFTASPPISRLDFRRMAFVVPIPTRNLWYRYGSKSAGDLSSGRYFCFLFAS